MKQVVLLLAIAFSALTTFGQSHQISPGSSDLTISGTSTVHDWESVVEQFSGSAEIKTEAGALESISDLIFTAEVKSIKSGKGGMDKKIYDALNEKKYKQITFKATKVEIMDDNSVEASGDLTISGVTKSILVIATYETQTDGNIVFSGSYPMKMTDFDVDPPTAVFGTIKSGNEIKINFNAKFIQ